jgi:type I site-specific restriction endonuclease
VVLRARTEAIARHLTEFLKSTDRFAKTIVFCVDQEHADEMRRALANLNADLVQKYPDYVCRVTAAEGAIGRGHMEHFQDVDRATPVILTTSQLLTTGLDAPTCKNVVLARLVGSMTEFKQIIGRGTRVRDDYDKFWFNIIDYTGSATAKFADPDFDGEPALRRSKQSTSTARPRRPTSSPKKSPTTGSRRQRSPAIRPRPRQEARETAGAKACDDQRRARTGTGRPGTIPPSRSQGAWGVRRNDPQRARGCEKNPAASADSRIVNSRT